jgi:outer membrane protein assembly factor BamA
MFQSLVANLRGYNQNGRNGDTYALMNAEIRIPITNTLMAYPSKMDFVRNLQGILFCDAGSAWNGLLPDAVNDSKIFNASANGVSTQFKIPWNGGLAVGMGAGLRTTLYGYFMRLDAAWNSDGGAKPVIYFSLGYDF